MKKTERKIISIVTAWTLLFSCMHSLPVTVKAEEETEEASAETIREETAGETVMAETAAEDPADEESAGEDTEGSVQAEETVNDAGEGETGPEEEGLLEGEGPAGELEVEEQKPDPEETDTPGEIIPGETETGDEIINDDPAEPEETEAGETAEAEEGPDSETAVENEETDPEGPAEGETADEVLYPAFSDAVTVDGVTVAVSAGEGIFPEGAYLSVENASAAQQEIVEEAVGNSRAADVNVAASYTFDIKVLDQDGNEVQPVDGRQVTVGFTAAEAADRNLDAAVYHVADGAAEALDISSEGNTLIAETDGFSFYTVEFTYGTLQYVLPGNGAVELSTILAALGIEGEVTSAGSSAPELFSAENTDGVWTVVSHHSFSTAETLTVTINGIDYVIEVTDPVEVYPVWFNGEQITSETCDDVYHDGGSVKYDPVTQTMTLNDPKLKDKIPFGTPGLIVVEGITLTITGTAVFDSHFMTHDGIDLINGANLIFDHADIVFNDPFRPISSYNDPSDGTVSQSKVTIQNSHVEALGKNWEGIAAGYIEIKSGTVIATGANYGLLGYEDVQIDDGYVDTSGIRAYHGDVIINGGTVIGPIDSVEGDINIYGGTVAADASKALWVYGYDYGLRAPQGIIRVGPGISSVVAEAEKAVVALYGIDIDPANVIAEPETYQFVAGPYPYSGLTTVSRSNTSTDPAELVIIIPAGSHKVEYKANGHGEDPVTKFVKDGEQAPKPIEPKEKGYTFMGWFTEPECTTRYDFSAAVTKDLTLYAKWCVNVKGFIIQADGTELDGTYYRLKTTKLEPVFEKDTAEVTIDLGHLCTDSGCSDVIITPPVKGTTYYFQVYMKDTSSYDKGIQQIMFLPEIKNNITASATEAKIELDWLTGTPNGDAVIIQFKYTEDVITYTVTNGADAEWQKDSAAGAEFTVERNIHDTKTYSLFESIEVDGTILAASDYTAYSGSLVATLEPSYLNTLPAGVHTVKFNFKDGSAETTLTIKEKPKPKPVPENKDSGPADPGTPRMINYLPNTGEAGHPGSWACILLMSLLSLAGLLANRRQFFE